MKRYNAISKRMPDGSIEYTVKYNLKSENELFFIDDDLDVVVLNEPDDKYIVHLGLFIEKLPFDYADEKIRVDGEAFWEMIEKNIINYILSDYYNEDDGFRKFALSNNFDVYNIRKELEKSDDYVDAFCNSFYKLTDYFDSWAVVKIDNNSGEIKNILLKPKEDKHIETVKWE
ncbi:MAG: hypothetical protein IJ224_07845 [Lachnospiraceae bacterium]|nr:hypothetical protein [Lachnospiraceae bacterium]